MNDEYVDNTEEVTEETAASEEQTEPAAETAEFEIPFESDPVETDEMTAEDIEEDIEMYTEVADDGSATDLITDRLDIIAVSAVLTCCISFLILVRLIKR